MALQLLVSFGLLHMCSPNISVICGFFYNFVCQLNYIFGHFKGFTTSPLKYVPPFAIFNLLFPPNHTKQTILTVNSLLTYLMTTPANRYFCQLLSITAGSNRVNRVVSKIYVSFDSSTFKCICMYV